MSNVTSYVATEQDMIDTRNEREEADKRNQSNMTSTATVIRGGASRGNGTEDAGGTLKYVEGQSDINQGLPISNFMNADGRPLSVSQLTPDSMVTVNTPSGSVQITLRMAAEEGIVNSKWLSDPLAAAQEFKAQAEADRKKAEGTHRVDVNNAESVEKAMMSAGVEAYSAQIEHLLEQHMEHGDTSLDDIDVAGISKHLGVTEKGLDTAFETVLQTKSAMVDGAIGRYVENTPAFYQWARDNHPHAYRAAFMATALGNEVEPWMVLARTYANSEQHVANVNPTAIMAAAERGEYGNGVTAKYDDRGGVVLSFPNGDVMSAAVALKHGIISAPKGASR